VGHAPQTPRSRDCVHIRSRDTSSLYCPGAPGPTFALETRASDLSPPRLHLRPRAYVPGHAACDIHDMRRYKTRPGAARPIRRRMVCRVASARPGSTQTQPRGWLCTQAAPSGRGGASGDITRLAAPPSVLPSWRAAFPRLAAPRRAAARPHVGADRTLSGPRGAFEYSQAAKL
jgi:hypothetical protein